MEKAKNFQEIILKVKNFSLSFRIFLPNPNSESEKSKKNFQRNYLEKVKIILKVKKIFTSLNTIPG